MAASEVSENFICWTDCEFTGLDVQRDYLLQIGVVVTDFALNSHAEYVGYLDHDPTAIEQAIDANEWWDERGAHKTATLAALVEEGKPAAQVEKELAEVTSPFFKDKITLAGNSPRTDLGFMQRFLPRFHDRLHYRVLDVSSFRVWVEGTQGLAMPKAYKHEALLDVRESIDELRFMLAALQGRPA